jgi:high affinity choline transporter 7
MGQVHWGGVIAVLLIYAVFVVVGWLASRKVKDGTAADLIVAGRSMPLWIATFTMTATWVDGGYLLGTAEGVFKPGGGLLLGVQGGLCFGISLMLGGLFFAKRMREHHFTTLIDPFESRFGKRWACVLFVPALLGEMIWSAELLVAIGATFATILGMDLRTAIIVSAAVVICYTMVGGMWSVAYTDAVQLLMIPVGLLVALPFALQQVGGWDACVSHYFSVKSGDAAWTVQRKVEWCDVSLMLMLGGIPWNCYFQRVLSCKSPVTARWHSFFSGALTILLTVPPLLLGMAALANQWSDDRATLLDRHPSSALPYLLRYMTPYWVGLLGLGAIIGAVTSSFSSSILSAGSMVSWNVYRRLLVPDASVDRTKLVIRIAITVVGFGAAVMALFVKSVIGLWFFTADLIFVLLVPQLIYALFDRRANLSGSVVAFVVSLALRLGGGEPLIGLPPTIPYPDLFAGLLPGGASSWYASTEVGQPVVLFPFKSFAWLAGMVLLPLVSRLTSRWDPPRSLRQRSERVVLEAGEWNTDICR